jgi:hypothetical protein
MGVLHPRLVNARDLRRRVDWTDQHVYVGRNNCPCGALGCKHKATLGNPFSVAQYGATGDVPRLFHRMLAGNPVLLRFVREVCKAPAVIVCHCDGTGARWCHGETLARVADGERVEAVAAEVARRFR